MKRKMAPTTSRRRTQKISTPTTRKIITRSIYKKEQQLSLLHSQKPPKEYNNRVESVSCFDNQEDDHQRINNNNNKSNINNSSSNGGSGDLCTTPKSEKYKIPEITTCPPAPKKPRNSTCLFQKRRPITFFAHPDLDKFFMFATPIRDIKGKQQSVINWQ